MYVCMYVCMRVQMLNITLLVVTIDVGFESVT
jgi:hypothetical protein